MEEQASNCGPTLKDRWNRAGKHARSSIVLLGLIGVFLALKTGYSMRAETVTTQLPSRLIESNTCKSDQDCQAPHMICNARLKCTALPNVIGSCSQPKVLTYESPDGRAKHTYCENGCEVTPKGARCL